MGGGGFSMGDEPVDGLSPLDTFVLELARGRTATIGRHDVRVCFIGTASGDAPELAGLSAGSICWFESGTTDSYGPALGIVDGALGLIAGSHCPHYDVESARRPTYQRLVAKGALPPGYAADDDAALVFDGGALVEVVAARPGVTAYRVEPAGDGTGAIEVALPARRLW